MRYRVTVYHSESRTLYHVVDMAQPAEEQPAVIATYHDPLAAARHAEFLNLLYSTWPVRAERRA